MIKQLRSGSPTRPVFRANSAPEPSGGPAPHHRVPRTPSSPSSPFSPYQVRAFVCSREVTA